VEIFFLEETKLVQSTLLNVSMQFPIIKKMLLIQILLILLILLIVSKILKYLSQYSYTI